MFSPASAYTIQFEGSRRFGWANFIWKTEAVLKMKIFSWLAVLGKCLTADNLIKRGWPHNPVCSLQHRSRDHQPPAGKLLLHGLGLDLDARLPAFATQPLPFSGHHQPSGVVDDFPVADIKPAHQGLVLCCAACLVVHLERKKRAYLPAQGF